MLPHPTNINNAAIKRLVNNAAHVAMRCNSVVERVAEAVRFAPAVNAVFDKPSLKFNFRRAIHKDARCFAIRQFAAPFIASKGMIAQPFVKASALTGLKA
tara:strand:- start:3742 stop:4041 length:300 start_codon:yes stop_codon:yes gene_type:complete